MQQKHDRSCLYPSHESVHPEFPIALLGMLFADSRDASISERAHACSAIFATSHRQNNRRIPGPYVSYVASLPMQGCSVAYRCKQVPAPPEESLSAEQAQPLGPPQELKKMSGLTLPQGLQLHLYQGRVALQRILLTGRTSRSKGVMPQLA